MTELLGQQVSIKGAIAFNAEQETYHTGHQGSWCLFSYCTDCQPAKHCPCSTLLGYTNTNDSTVFNIAIVHSGTEADFPIYYPLLSLKIAANREQFSRKYIIQIDRYGNWRGFSFMHPFNEQQIEIMSLVLEDQVINKTSSKNTENEKKNSRGTLLPSIRSHGNSSYPCYMTI